jgi:hypothetical protein
VGNLGSGKFGLFWQSNLGSGNFRQREIWALKRYFKKLGKLRDYNNLVRDFFVIPHLKKLSLGR